MKKISLVIFLTLLFPPLINGDTGLSPVTEDIYQELLNLRRSIGADRENLIEIAKKSSDESEKEELKTVAEHFQAVDTTLTTFITLLPVESYHNLAQLLEKPDFDNTTHNIPALEFINVQCLLSVRYLNKKMIFIKKKISNTKSTTLLRHLGKLEEHIKAVIKTLNYVNAHLDILIKSHK